MGAVLGCSPGAALGNVRTDAVPIGPLAAGALGSGVTYVKKARRYYRNGYSYRSSQPYYRDSRYRGYDPAYYGRDYDNRYRYGGDRYGYRD